MSAGRQVDHPADRRMWRAAVDRWLAAGRPEFLELRRADAAPPAPRIGGQREACRQPLACESGTPDLCRACAAILASSKRAA